MLKLHIANTFFEWELETEPKMALSEAFYQHPIFRQLQFLPILYAKEEEGALLADMPSTQYWATLREKQMPIPKVQSLEERMAGIIESWGPSRLVAEWADKYGLTYKMPDWQIVKRVNSKQFSFEHSPKLPCAELLTTQTQVQKWVTSFPGTKVLKTCYGVSGKGHLIIDDTMSKERLIAFLMEQWRQELPVIAEPWVDRLLDFSTQWKIDESGQVIYLGATLCHNDARGQYQYNQVGDEKRLFHSYYPHLLAHQAVAREVLQKIAQLGFFGNVGIDAMLYQDIDGAHLHPIVEINARKTMGWLALQIQQRYFRDQSMRLSYGQNVVGLLPEFVETKQKKKVRFARNLSLSVEGLQ